MAFSIESRVPFLTPSLAKFHLTLPGHYIIIPNGTSKDVYRQAMGRIMPDVILERTDKMGFPTPERNWLLSIRPYVERVRWKPFRSKSAIGFFKSRPVVW